MYKCLCTRLGSIAIKTHWPELDNPRWICGRGRRRELIVIVPLFGWEIELQTLGKSYAKLTGCPRYSLDWILDEFDSSFNDLAVASLRFHLDFACTDNEERRERYEDIIARLTEPSPDFTTEELSVLHPAGWDFDDDFEVQPDGGAIMLPTPPEKKVIYSAYWERERAYAARIQQARHDFVDIMPHLWS